MTEDGRREAVAEELQLAADELAAAEQLMTASHHRIAVARAYFAVFHAARARLYAAGLEPKSHAGVHQLWSTHMVKSGSYEPESARVLARLQRFRELADYSRDFVVDEAAAREDVTAATEFVTRIRDELTSGQ